MRHHFGITSFGINAWTGREAGDRIINEHDEEGEDEELYFVHSGRARFEFDGERVDAPAGTFVFARPSVNRTAFAEEPGTTILAAGGTPGQVYTPTGWELWAPAGRLRRGGTTKRPTRLGTWPRHPQYPLLLYNLACCESLAGRKADALEHLRLAIETSDRVRSYLAEDSDLDRSPRRAGVHRRSSPAEAQSRRAVRPHAPTMPRLTLRSRRSSGSIREVRVSLHAGVGE